MKKITEGTAVRDGAPNAGSSATRRKGTTVPKAAKRRFPAALGVAFGLLLALSPVLGLAGCARAIAAEDLMDGAEPASTAAAPSDVEASGPGAEAVTDFSVRLFQQCAPGEESMLVSPLSALYALGMTANGAKGETLSQMEGTFGLTVGELNAYLGALAHDFPDQEGCRLDLANSLWIKDSGDFAVEPAFLQANADYYNAGAFLAPFDDTTLEDINAWTDDHTNGMIPRILDEISPRAFLYLVNALAFEAAWLDEYEDGDVQDAAFTCEDGSVRTAKLMHSWESAYLEDAKATGVVKRYEGGRFAFAALLPNEGTSVSDYAASLTGEGLRATLENARHDVDVDAALPKFSGDWGCDLAGALDALGMADAFDLDRADFSGIAGDPGEFFVDSVVHKTHVEVDEHGTKAAAATAVVMECAAAMPEEREVKTVHLDRPFVYLIVDCDTNVPLFIGTVMDVEE